MAWTDKMVEDLKVMWKQGLTTGEIGRRLNVSKNSVIGKVHRLQLDARPSPIKRKDETGDLFAPKPQKKEKKPLLDKEKKITTPIVEPKQPKPVVEKVTEKISEKTVVKKIEPQEKSIDDLGKFFLKQPTVSKEYNGNAKLTDLDNHTCRWPLGDPKDENFHFCGRKVRLGQTYCEEHSALAYVKAVKK